MIHALVSLAIATSTAGASDTHPKKTITKPTLYVVGYSHLDTQWCWTYPQVIREFIPNTLHENFRLFDKYPEYVFNWTGSNRYRFMKEYYPADYARLKKYIAAGRWFPAGSSVEEGDVNSPSSESIIRQVLYGNEFFRDEFGIASDEYMLPDCFGFPASLPSILAHCGIKGFSTQKLTWGSAYRGPGPRQGVPFNVGNWTGPDGRSVVAALNATPYDSDIGDDLSKDPTWITRMEKDDVGRDGVPADYRYYGVGDRGGAPHESSVQNVIKSMHGDGPLHIVSGRADQMFNDLSAAQIVKLPDYKGDLELTQHSAGSPTSEAAMKRWNRKNELLADDTERASVAADWLGALPYDKARITDAWLRFLPGQFHDLMAGTALPLAYNYTWNDEILAMNEFAGQLQASVGGVARALDTRGNGVPIVVYNPLSRTREDVVEATFTSDGPPPKSIEVVGPDGHLVPFQVVSRDLAGGKTTLLFLARVPSVGFAVLHVRAAGGVQPKSPLRVTPDSLENNRYRVRLDSNGDVASVFDKSIGKELLAGPARLVYMHENPSQFPAWNMDWSDQRKPPASVVTGPAKVEIAESGPVRVALRVTREHDGSKFVQTIRLADGDAGNRVEFATEIDWRGKETALKAEFPLTASNPTATYNWGIGTVDRGNNDPQKYEVVSHGWSSLTNAAGDYGASILDDSKYASDKPNDNTMRLTLLYTPGTRGGYQHQGTQDWGHHEMIYALEAHRGKGQLETQWQSLELNQPLLAFQTTAHPGVGLKGLSLASVSDPRVEIEALKQSEKGSTTLVRLNELSGSEVDGVHVHFAAPVMTAVEVDGQERKIGPATISNGDLEFSTTGYRPHTFAVRLDEPRRSLNPVRSQPIALPFNLDGISSWEHKTDGNFDGTGKTLPGELLPKKIVSDGVEFRLGPTAEGAKNVLAARGQVVPVPAGNHRRIYFLGASASGDIETSFQISVGNRFLGNCPVKFQAWDGYIGQWDYRLWQGKVPELAYDWSNALSGLMPGYIKRDSVAWCADHRRLADGTNDIYHFCYLYRYAIDLPDGVKDVTLPNDPRVRILAATVASNPADDTLAVQALYDVIDHRDNTAPGISVASLTGAPEPAGARSFDNTVSVSFTRPAYWSDSQTLRYTLDGTKPGPQSSVAGDGPVFISKSAKVEVAQFDGSRETSPVGAISLTVNDTTPPAIQSAVAVPFDSAMRVRFSEPVDLATAQDLSHYSISPEIPIQSAALSQDGRTVTLSLLSPVPPGTDYSISVTGVRDRSPNANVLTGGRAPVERLHPVFEFPGPQAFDGHRGTSMRTVPNLPVRGTEPWTLNVFLFSDTAPGDLTILAGFGDGGDRTRAERFFVVHDGGVEFWGSNVDIGSGQPFDLNRWQMFTATYDGHLLKLYKDGREVKTEATRLEEAVDSVRLAPPPAWGDGHRFAGSIAGLTIWNHALPPAAVQALAAGGPPN